MRGRGDEGCGAVESGGTETGTTYFHRKEGLRPGSVRERVAEDPGEGSELKGVEVEEGRF